MTWLRFLVATAIIFPALIWTMPHPWFVTAIIAGAGLVAGHLAQRAAQQATKDRRKLIFGAIAAVVCIGLAAGVAGMISRGDVLRNDASSKSLTPSPLSPVEHPIEVILSGDGTVTVAGRFCALGDVTGRLGELDIDRGVLVVTAQDVERETFQALMEQLSKAGVTKIALKTED